MSNPGDDAREVMAKDRRSLQSFDKMQPGEVDKIFQAVCPQCDQRIWIFAIAENTVPAAIDPDCRICNNCGYVHWLRGPNTSKVVPLPSMSSAYPAKKDRVRTLVLALLASGAVHDDRLVSRASKIDDEIEAIK
jgi:hypothetical protein